VTQLLTSHVSLLTDVQRSKRLCVEIYRTLKEYGFKEQITRSALSISSNIAEGFERISAKECVTFLPYAKGSCGELRTQIYVGIDIDYVSREVGNRWLKETEEISLMLGGLIKAKKSFAQK
jgi:four helix bundle protein